MNEEKKQYIAEQMYEMEEMGVCDPETTDELLTHYGGWLSEIFDM